MKTWRAVVVLAAVLPAAVLACRGGMTLFRKAAAPVKVGEPARDFRLRTSDGEVFHLAAFKGRKVVVLGVGNPFG